MVLLLMGPSAVYGRVNFRPRLVLSIGWIVVYCLVLLPKDANIIIGAYLYKHGQSVKINRRVVVLGLHWQM